MVEINDSSENNYLNENQYIENKYNKLLKYNKLNCKSCIYSCKLNDNYYCKFFYQYLFKKPDKILNNNKYIKKYNFNKKDLKAKKYLFYLEIQDKLSEKYCPLYYPKFFRRMYIKNLFYKFMVKFIQFFDIDKKIKYDKSKDIFIINIIIHMIIQEILNNGVILNESMFEDKIYSYFDIQDKVLKINNNSSMDYIIYVDQLFKFKLSDIIDILKKFNILDNRANKNLICFNYNYFKEYENNKQNFYLFRKHFFNLIF